MVRYWIDLKQRISRSTFWTKTMPSGAQRSGFLATNSHSGDVPGIMCLVLPGAFFSTQHPEIAWNDCVHASNIPNYWNRPFFSIITAYHSILSADRKITSILQTFSQLSMSFPRNQLRHVGTHRDLEGLRRLRLEIFRPIFFPISSICLVLQDKRGMILMDIELLDHNLIITYLPLQVPVTHSKKHLTSWVWGIPGGCTPMDSNACWERT